MGAATVIPDRVSEPAVTLTHDDLPVPDTSTTADSRIPDPRSPLQYRPITRRGGHNRPRRALRPSIPARRDPRRRDVHRAGARTRPHRRRATPTLGWRLFVATLGALLLVLVSGMALGIVTVSPSGLGLRFNDAAQPPVLVTGTDGIYPGGGPHSVSLTVRNTVASAFEISKVSAALGGLPASCPASVWRIEAPELMPTVPARSEVTVPLPVALTADAPDACQGLTVRFPVTLDGLRHPLASGTAPATGTGTSVEADAAEPGRTPNLRPERLESIAVVTTARLGSPGGTLSVRGGQVSVLPSPATSGPVPTSYDVETLDGAGRTGTICTAVAGQCLDRRSPPAAARQYLVTARVGAHWRRRSPTLHAWTPPPTPALRFGGGSAPSELVVTASSGDRGYEIALYADGAITPFHTLRTAAGSSLHEAVDLPDLGVGTHSFVAVSRFHGWRAPSGTLRLTVSNGGNSTPQPPDEPAPITSDSAHPPLTTSGPPVPVPPTASVPTAAPSSRTTRATARSTVVRAPAPAAPPHETLPDLMTSTPRRQGPAPVMPAPPTASIGPAGQAPPIPVPTLPR